MPETCCRPSDALRFINAALPSFTANTAGLMRNGLKTPINSSSGRVIIWRTAILKATPTQDGSLQEVIWFASSKICSNAAVTSR